MSSWTFPFVVGGLLDLFGSNAPKIGYMGNPVVGEAISAPDLKPPHEVKLVVLTSRLRKRKTASPGTWRRNHWNELDDEAADLLSAHSSRLYEAEKALLWRFGYSWKDARETLRRGLLARYAAEIASRKAFGTEVSATK